MACDCIVSGDMMEQFEAAPFTLSRGGKGKRRERERERERELISSTGSWETITFLSLVRSRCTFVVWTMGMSWRTLLDLLPVIRQSSCVLLYLSCSLASFFHRVLYGVQYTLVCVSRYTLLRPLLLFALYFFFLAFTYFLIFFISFFLSIVVDCWGGDPCSSSLTDNSGPCSVCRTITTGIGCWTWELAMVPPRLCSLACSVKCTSPKCHGRWGASSLLGDLCNYSPLFLYFLLRIPSSLRRRRCRLVTLYIHWTVSLPTDRQL